MKLNADNLTVDTTADQKITIEPEYLAFLRSQGYLIEQVLEANCVQSESDSETAHIVVKVQTYQYPRDNPRLDLIEDEHTITVCDCWAYRQDSVDVREETLAEGTLPICKHIRKLYREARARNDEQQATLLGENDE